jgi:hypothetical protein
MNVPIIKFVWQIITVFSENGNRFRAKTRRLAVFWFSDWFYLLPRQPVGFQRLFINNNNSAAGCHIFVFFLLF